MASKQYVYFFGASRTDGTKDMKALLGGKGANLAEMLRLGLPVPPGFTISTEACRIYDESHGELPQYIRDEVLASISVVEKEMGRKFGDSANPLLFSVRSGAAVSMPGMMDTVLNLGLNDATVEAWCKRQPDMSRFVYDSYRRFISMYADVVMHAGHDPFEHALDAQKHKAGAKLDSELSAEHLAELCATLKGIYKDRTGEPFPQEPLVQLFAAIGAVFRSWGNERAVSYRAIHNIAGLIGTAVTVQSMVFGNLNERSSTGVAFSRNPSTGEKIFYGEYLINAQGEDVVAGIRTPQQIGKAQSLEWAHGHDVPEAVRVAQFPSMEESMPQNYATLVEIKEKLEQHYRDMQDIEFTVEDGKLWMLQCRNGKRTTNAAVKIAVDMVAEGLLTREEAVMRIAPSSVDQLLHKRFDPNAKPTRITKGLAASPGAAVGQVVFTPAAAVEWKAQGKKVILVRLETSPEDVAGMHASEGILTVRGGMTSHAAVVARGMGTTCVCGAGDIIIRQTPRVEFYIKGNEQRVYTEGDWIAIDGSIGAVYDGKVPLIDPDLHGDFHMFMQWCQEAKRLGVRANADTPVDARTAMGFGAEGVGLCRTEHMFFEGDRIDTVREMILATELEGRLRALQKILPLQRADFEGIFRAMPGRTCTIRLLDPPLHEFVPHTEEKQAALAEKIGIPLEQVINRVKNLHEENPMLGNRGVRLGISYPEIYDTQVQAIMEAAVALKAEGADPHPEIMIPLVGKVEELAFSKKRAVEVAERVLREAGVTVPYSIGTMIEVPRAALTADQIATEAAFFSFGTNDLTQMGCGFSRDDCGPFLQQYVRLGIYKRDPFESLDQEGVGQLIKIAIEKGRSTNPHLHLGICGEHGGDPDSIDFCHRAGLDYVSCSPYRVPIAIVAAAHAAINAKKKQ